MSRRGVTILGLAAAGGVGYYLYTAGGDPKVAEKNFKGTNHEHIPSSQSLISLSADAAKAEAKVKSEIPGTAKEYEKKGEAQAAKAGQKFDKAVSLAVDDHFEALILTSGCFRWMTPVARLPKLRPKPRISRNRLAKRPIRRSSSLMPRWRKRRAKPRAV